jgi:16S rRNA (guanine966-N2)-methyltransferase
MKDRVREAVFNLIGPGIAGKHAVDLFAGTGALGLEALSRGASRATLVERHFPTAGIAKENVVALGVAEQTEVVTADTFLWARDHPTSDLAWAVFCSPPYDFYHDRATEMIKLIGSLVDRAPPQSVVVVEADRRFDFQTLPHPDRWDVRSYPPAVIGLLRV